MSRKHQFELTLSEDDEDVAYLRLPEHPGTKPGVVRRTVSLRELIGAYVGPDVNLDFGEGDELIGIESIG